MKTLMIVIFLVLSMLVFTDLVQARPDDMSPKEWRELKLETRKEKSVVSKTIAPEPKSSDCEVMVLNLDPTFPVYFVESRCLAQSLAKIPNAEGNVLYCKLGYLSDPQTFAIFSAAPGKNGLDGWQYCSEV